LSAAHVLAAAALAATLAGCATILGLEHNDGEDAGSDAGGLDVAKIIVRDAHLRDVAARPDAGRKDAGGHDAAMQPDVGVDAPVCPGAFCACLGRDAALCLDFDEGSSPSDLGIVVTVGGGELSLGPSTVSPPHALESLLPGGATTTQAAILVDTVGVSASYDLNFSLQVGPCTLQGTSNVVTLLLSTGATASVGLFGLDGGPDAPVGLATGTADMGVLIPLGVWTAVDLQVSPGTQVLTLEGAAVTSPLDVPVDAAVSDSATLQIGQVAIQSNACTILVDNLTVDQGI
jgi:hypothetical protein